MMIPEPQSVRLEALKEELENASSGYIHSKEEFDRARVRFEINRERFARTKELARDMMTTADWQNWQTAHPKVRYAATQIGTAILQLLQSKAWKAAVDYAAHTTKSYNPAIDLDTIIKELESGGFEFHSTAPSREANAALINLAGVMKTPENCYMVDNPDTVMMNAQHAVERWIAYQEQQQKAVAESEDLPW